MSEEEISVLNNRPWEELYRLLPKPQLRYFYQVQSEANCLQWINCQNEDLRALSFLWPTDLISLEPEIRRAVAEAKSLKGVSFTNHPGASHQPFRYHADNACYRLFAAMDKVGQLLNTHLGLTVRYPDLNKVIKALTERADLKDTPEPIWFIRIVDAGWYKSLSEYRHSLTHRLSPVCENQESFKILLSPISSFLEFKPIGYTIDQLDNLISNGHQHIVTTIEQCESLLNRVPGERFGERSASGSSASGSGLTG